MPKFRSSHCWDYSVVESEASLLRRASRAMRSSNLTSIPFKFPSTRETLSEMLFSTPFTASLSSFRDVRTLLCSSSRDANVLENDAADV